MKFGQARRSPEAVFTRPSGRTIAQRGAAQADNKEGKIASRTRQRHSLESSELARQVLNQQTARLEKQIMGARAKDDAMTASDALHRSARHYQQNRNRYEKIVSADLFGSEAWMRLRKMQLRKLPGGEVAARQYGQRFASDLQSGQASHSRLALENKDNPDYLRIGVRAQFEENCQDLYVKSCNQSASENSAGQPAAEFASFVNSPAAVKFMMENCPGMDQFAGLKKTRLIAPGLVAIPCSGHMEKMELNRVVGYLGFRPSPALTVRLAAGKAGPAAKAAHNVTDNLQLLNQLRTAMGADTLRQLRQVQKALPVSTLAHSDADMIEDLFDVLSRPEVARKNQHNPLVEHGLKGIQLIADMLPSLVADTARFANAHQALMEEIYVVLNAARPYDSRDFKQAAASRIDAAIPPAVKPAIMPPSPALFSSGMNAFSQGFLHAFKEAKGKFKPLLHGDKETSFYYEGSDLLDLLEDESASENAAKEDPIYFTSLGDSYVPHVSEPGHDWTLDNMLGGIRDKLAQRPPSAGPLNMVVDTTVENEQDMQRLMDTLGPDLAANRLRLFMCKSHQKFASFGAGKVMGGSVTLLGQDNPENRRIQQKLDEASVSQGWSENDESQLLTHCSRAAKHHEPALLKNAIANASFVAQHCFHGRNGHAEFAGASEHQPFAMLHRYGGDAECWPRLVADSANNRGVPVDPASLINQNLVRMRNSFGFVESTISTIDEMSGYKDDMTRISFGQENKNELIERFWMPGRLMQPGIPPVTARSMLDTVQELVDAELPPEQRGEAMSLRDKLVQIGKHEAAALTDSQRNQEDVATLRSRLALSEKFTLNKVASVVGHFGYLLKQKIAYEVNPATNNASATAEERALQILARADDRHALESLLSAFIGSGMPGVSHTSCEQALALQCALCHIDMQHEERSVRQKGIDTLLNTLQHAPLNPGPAVFPHSIPDQAYLEQTPHIQRQLQEALFSHLDPGNQLLFLQQESAKPPATRFLLDCGAGMERELHGGATASDQQSWLASVRAAVLQNKPGGKARQ